MLFAGKFILYGFGLFYTIYTQYCGISKHFAPLCPPSDTIIVCGQKKIKRKFKISPDILIFFYVYLSIELLVLSVDIPR